MEPVFSKAFELTPGDVAAVVGCGGKTSLIDRLCWENRGGRVLRSTTTRILTPPEELFDLAIDASKSGSRRIEDGVTLVFGGRENGKLTAPEPKALAEHCPADGLSFLECDGSRGLPLKGWAEHEPVVPKNTTLTVGVCALWAVGMPLSENVAHRPGLFSALTGCARGDIITLGHVSAMLASPGGMFARASGRKYLLVNQAESPEALEQATALAGMLPAVFRESLSGVFAGSARRGTLTIL